MSALSLRRSLLLVVPLALLLAGCNAGQSKLGVPAGLGDTNPGIEQPAGLVEAHPSCPDIDEPPCPDDTGCQPSLEEIVAPGVGADFSWTHDCQLDGYSLNLFRYESGVDPIYWTAVPGSARSFHLASGLSRGTYYWTIRGSWLGTPTAYHQDGRYEGDEASTGFVVGSLCEEPEQIAPPYNGDPVYTLWMPDSPHEVFFHWSYDFVADCLPDRFEGQIAEDSGFTTNVMELVPVLRISQSVFSEPLYRCDTYYWRVRGMLNEEPGPWSETWVFSVGPEEDCQGPVMPIGAVEAVAIQDSACRIGPSTIYGIAGYAEAGERRMIVGRNADGAWYKTIEGCYVHSRLLRVELVQGTPFPQGADVGDLMSLIPEVPDPPTPTVPTTECKATLAQGQCSAAGGMWVCATKCGTTCTESCTCDCP